MPEGGLRIVSLLPSATEIACGLGLRGRLVGRSHECDWPAGVSDLPVVTRSKLEKGLSSRQIEDRVQEIVGSGLSVYEVDTELLRELRPDVILTQTQCAVCAVTPDDLQAALNDWTGKAPQLVSLAPDNLTDVWGDIARVGEAVAMEKAGDALVARLQGRMAAIRAVVADRVCPRVAAIEWLDPPMVAGNWVPELIEMAGGESLLATPGQHSPWTSWDDVEKADPDVIVLMPCGFRIEQTLAELPVIAADPRWQHLRAVRDGAVYATDGQYFFNRPGPRLVESAEILAEILHGPVTDYGHKGSGWVEVEREALQPA